MFYTTKVPNTVAIILKILFQNNSVYWRDEIHRALDQPFTR